MTTANMITLLRFFLIPGVIFAMLIGDWRYALAGFVIAGLSDAVDGFVARHFNQRSKLGAYMDPIADKLLLVSVFVLLAWLGHLPLWLVVAAVSRDLLIVGAVVLSSVMSDPVEVKPLLVSKANTAVQIVLVAVILAQLAFATSFGPLAQALILLSGLLTVASAAAYFLGWLRHMTRHGESAS